MAINNQAIVKNLDKKPFVPQEHVNLSVSVCKKVRTQLLNDAGEPLDSFDEKIINLSVDETFSPKIDQSLSADDLRIECLIDAGLLQDVQIPPYLTASTPEAVKSNADALFKTLLKELDKNTDFKSKSVSVDAVESDNNIKTVFASTKTE